MRLLRLFLKWFLYIIAGLLALITLFLVVPGFECSWRTHAEDPPLLALTRQKIGHMELRQIRVAEWHVGVFLLSSTLPPGPPRGGTWRGGTYVYVGDSWLFTAGTIPPGGFYR